MQEGVLSEDWERGVEMRIDDFKDCHYYHYLGIDRQYADPDDLPDLISSSYRRLIRKYHPDSNTGNPKAEERARKLNEAYEVLSDPVRRKLYDQWLEKNTKNTAGRYDRWTSSTGADRHTKAQETAETKKESEAGESFFYRVNVEELRKHAYSGYEKWKREKEERLEREARRRRKARRGFAVVFVMVVLLAGAAMAYVKRDDLPLWIRQKLPATLVATESKRNMSGGKKEEALTERLAVSGVSEGREAPADAPEGDVGRLLKAYSVTGDAVNIRPTPSTEQDRIGKLTYGSVCTGTGVVSDDGRWIEIYLSEPGGETGWVSAGYVVENGETRSFDEENANKEGAVSDETADPSIEAAIEATSSPENQNTYDRFHDEIDKNIRDFVPDPLNTVYLSVGQRHKPNAAIWSSITVYSSDESVVTVTDTGTVTAVGPGEAYVVIISNTSIQVNAVMGTGLMMEVIRYTVR